MKRRDYIVKSFINAAGVFIYVSAVAWFGFNSKRIFGQTTDSFLAPLFVLLLFVISASVTGLLVLGKPISLYLSGSKKEAWTMLFATLAWLAFFLTFTAIAMLMA